MVRRADPRFIVRTVSGPVSDTGSVDDFGSVDDTISVNHFG